MQILIEQKDVAEGAVSKAVEVVPIPLHPITYSVQFHVYLLLIAPSIIDSLNI